MVESYAAARFALRVHDLFRHGYTFTDAVRRAAEVRDA
jgi:hypothetical protein